MKRNVKLEALSSIGELEKNTLCNITGGYVVNVRTTCCQYETTPGCFYEDADGYQDGKFTMWRDWGHGGTCGISTPTTPYSLKLK